MPFIEALAGRWSGAIQALMLVVEHGGDTMLPRIGIIAANQNLKIFASTPPDQVRELPRFASERQGPVHIRTGGGGRLRLSRGRRSVVRATGLGRPRTKSRPPLGRWAGIWPVPHRRGRASDSRNFRQLNEKYARMACG